MILKKKDREKEEKRQMDKEEREKDKSRQPVYLGRVPVTPRLGGGLF